MKIQWKVGTTLSQWVSRWPHAARQRPRFESYLRPFAAFLPPLFLPSFLSIFTVKLSNKSRKCKKTEKKNTVKSAKSMPSFFFPKPSSGLEWSLWWGNSSPGLCVWQPGLKIIWSLMYVFIYRQTLQDEDLCLLSDKWLTFGTWGLNSTALCMASTAFISAVLSPRLDAASGENLRHHISH